MRNNEGSLNNLYSCFPCALCYTLCTTEHLKDLIFTITSLTTGKFQLTIVHFFHQHLFMWTTKRQVDLPTLFWVEVSHLRSLDKFKWNWYGILPTLTKCLLWSQTCFIRRIYRQKVCTLLVNECKSSLSLLISVHIWMFINIIVLHFAQHGSLIINLGIMNWVFWDLHYIKYKNVVLHVS